jgi:hypothetical protein
VFSLWSLPRSYSQESWSNESIEFSTGDSEDRTLARAAEEIPLLEVIAREQLMKTQQAEKGIAGAVVICKAIAL